MYYVDFFKNFKHLVNLNLYASIVVIFIRLKECPFPIISTRKRRMITESI